MGQMSSMPVVKTGCGLWVIMQSRERVHHQLMFMEFTATVFVLRQLNRVRCVWTEVTVFPRVLLPA
jgi:hypothetical protein